MVLPVVDGMIPCVIGFTVVRLVPGAVKLGVLQHLLVLMLCKQINSLMSISAIELVMITYLPYHHATGGQGACALDILIAAEAVAQTALRPKRIVQQRLLDEGQRHRRSRLRRHRQESSTQKALEMIQMGSTMDLWVKLASSTVSMVKFL